MGDNELDAKEKEMMKKAQQDPHKASEDMKKERPTLDERQKAIVIKTALAMQIGCDPDHIDVKRSDGKRR
jgi:hypothetical protein